MSAVSLRRRRIRHALLVQERREEQTTERERPLRCGMTPQQKHRGKQDDDPLASGRILATCRERQRTHATTQPSVPTMLRMNGGPTAGQSSTTSNTPCCCMGERSRAVRIASPVPMPASVSYALKNTRKTPIPRRVAIAAARPNSSARRRTESATSPTSTSWITWKTANHVAASRSAATVSSGCG